MKTMKNHKWKYHLVYFDEKVSNKVFRGGGGGFYLIFPVKIEGVFVQNLSFLLMKLNWGKKSLKIFLGSFEF